MSRPLAVAVTGGIGAGKSEALEAFGRRGVPVHSSDEIVHRLLREDQEVRDALAERYGKRVFRNGEVERGELARIVFRDRIELDWLERLLHPRTAAEYVAWREELAGRSEPPAVCVVEIPLLYETASEARFDAVVVITAPEPVRSARARVSIEERSGKLIPDDEKVERADFAYVNDGTLDELDAFVAGVLEQLARRC